MNSGASSTFDDNAGNDIEHVKRRVFTDETYQLLRDTQWKIYNATGFTPDFAKLLEHIVTIDSSNHTADYFIETLG